MDVEVTVTARVFGRDGRQESSSSRTVSRKTGAPSLRYAVHDVEFAAAEAVGAVAAMVEAAHGRSTIPARELP
jgi:hypothetical protein